MLTVHMSIGVPLLLPLQTRWAACWTETPAENRLEAGRPVVPTQLPGYPTRNQPCRHFPLRAQDLPKSNRLSSNLSLWSPPLSCLPYTTTHGPAGFPGSTCARENENPPACPYPAGPGEPVLPLATPIAALVTSARETAPKHSARPLAHDNILRPLDHPSGSPRCLLSTALRRRSFSSLLQLRGPMRRPHKG